MRLRRLLTGLTAVLAVLTGAPDDSDDDRREELPSWATRTVVAPDHVEVDLADSATGRDLAAFVAALPRRVGAEFHTATGARLRVTRAGGPELDPDRLDAVSAAWLAWAAEDGSADAELDTGGTLRFDDGS